MVEKHFSLDDLAKIESKLLRIAIETHTSGLVKNLDFCFVLSNYLFDLCKDWVNEQNHQPCMNSEQYLIVVPYIVRNHYRHWITSGRILTNESKYSI